MSKVITDKPKTYDEIEQAFKDGLLVELSIIDQNCVVFGWREVDRIEGGFAPERYRISSR